MREITPHPEMQRSFQELRQEFREENLKRVRGMISSLAVSISGRIHKTRFFTDNRKLSELSQQMIEAMASSISNPSRCPIKQTFGLSEVPRYLSEKLRDKARESETFDSVSIPGGVDHDGPPLESLDEPSILSYMEKLADVQE